MRKARFRRAFSPLLLLLAPLVLSGCWSQHELPELGFVMGVALDEAGDGNIALTAQIYRPTPSGTSQGKSRSGSAFVNIRTEDNSVEEAIRDIPLHLGRRAQWSHMRLILVSERIAARRNVGELLDVFYRDHEPRLTASVAVTEGDAAEFLTRPPLVEQTTSQQLLRAMQDSYSNAGKTIKSNLLLMGMEMLGGNGDAALPYVSKKMKGGSFTVAGAALLKKGKMVGMLESKYVEGLLMLRDSYPSGMQNLPCPGQPDKTESVEVLSYSRRLKPVLSEDHPSVLLNADVAVAIGELKCTVIKTKKDEQKFVNRLEQLFAGEISETYELLQQQRIDVIGIGQRIFAHHPALWRKWKPDWERRFAAMPLSVRVHIQIVTSGTSISRPAVDAEGAK